MKKFKSFVFIAVMVMLVLASCDSDSGSDSPSNSSGGNLGNSPSNASVEGSWYLREPSDPLNNYAMLKFAGKNLTVGIMLGGEYLQYSGTFTQTNTEINYTINEIGSGTTTYTLSGITLWINDIEGVGGTFLGEGDTPQIGDSLDDLPDPGNAFKYHDNYLMVATLYGDEDGNFDIDNKAHDKWNITGGIFEGMTYAVTSGQDPENRLGKKGVYYLDKNRKFCFEFGRKGSKEVAASFNSACPPAHNTFNHTAGDLNFWMKGHLQLHFAGGYDFTFLNTYFAQGHSGAVNNWWFGNDTMVNYKYPTFAYDPYSTRWDIPLPIYGGDKCFGYISPVENPDLVFKFLRGEGLFGTSYDKVFLIGVYTKSKVKW